MPISKYQARNALKKIYPFDRLTLFDRPPAVYLNNEPAPAHFGKTWDDVIDNANKLYENRNQQSLNIPT